LANLKVTKVKMGKAIKFDSKMLMFLFKMNIFHFKNSSNVQKPCTKFCYNYLVCVFFVKNFLKNIETGTVLTFTKPL